MNRQGKEELFHLMEMKQQRAQLCPIGAMKLHDGQQRILDVCDPTPITMVLAGNRFGKTHFLVSEIISSLIGYRPYLVSDFRLDADGSDNKFPLRKNIPPSAWVYRPDGLPIRYPANITFITGLGILKGVGDVLQPKWQELWPSSVKYKVYLGPAGTWIRLKYGGSVLTIAADTQDPSTFEGAAYDRVFVDEPIRKQVFTPVRRGLIDQGGNILWCMTPVGDSNVAWISHDIILNKKRTDNKVIFGKGSENPHINKEALNAFLQDPTLSEDERKARTSGELSTLGKRIVSTYEERTAVISPTDIPSEVPRMLVVDPHHSKPACLVWFALMSQEHWVIYREMPFTDITRSKVPNTGTEDLAAQIKAAEGKENVVYRVCDPSFGRQHAKVLGERYRSFQEEMFDYGLIFDAHVDNNLERGIAKLRDAFRFNSVTRRPKVQIFSNLANCRASMSMWAYTTMPNSQLKPSEEFKDFADCIRYGVMYNPMVDGLEEIGTHSYLVDEEDED